MRKPRIIFFDIDGTEPDLDDYFAVAKSTVPVSPDFDAMAFGADNGLVIRLLWRIAALCWRRFTEENV